MGLLEQILQMMIPTGAKKTVSGPVNQTIQQPRQPIQNVQAQPMQPMQITQPKQMQIQDPRLNPNDPASQGYPPDITYNSNPNIDIPYSAHTPELAQMGNRYVQNPTSPEFLNVDPGLFGYPADNTVQNPGVNPNNQFRQPKSFLDSLNLFR